MTASRFCLPLAVLLLTTGDAAGRLLRGPHHKVRVARHPSLLQRVSRSRLNLPRDADDLDGFEYGDKERHARDMDSSDYSAEQFLVADDGRDAISKTANMDAATEARRQAVLASADHFGSEDTPSYDDFVQVGARTARHMKRRSARHMKRRPNDADDLDGFEYGDKERHARDMDSSDYSAEQFLVADDGRDAISKTANMDAATEARRQAVLASADHFGSEDTPSYDDFVQVGARTARHMKRRPNDADDLDGFEYGDKERHARDMDSSDYSAEQFLVADDGRDAISKTANMDAATEARRQAVLASADHFGSEDTPSYDD